MNKSNSQVATGSQNLRSVVCADAGAVFGKGDITHIVQAPFEKDRDLGFSILSFSGAFVSQQ